MLRQSLTVLTIVMIGFALVPDRASADGDRWERFWADFERDRYRNYAWPQPFLHRDQMAIRSIFSPMVAAGWRSDMTLSEYHFDPETNELNTAGVMKVQSILRNAPRSVQSVFVHSGFDPEITETRLAAVRGTLGQWMPEESFPAVVATTERPFGMSGSAADSINRKWADALPTPVLPASGAGGGGGN